MTDYRVSNRVDDREFIIDVLANENLVGEGLEGKEVAGLMNELFPCSLKMRPASPGKPYLDGNVFSHAVFQTVIDQLSEDRPEARHIRAATPEDFVLPMEEDGLRGVWGDIGVVVYGLEGENSEVAKKLYEEGKKRFSTEPIPERPWLFYGLRAERADKGGGNSYWTHGGLQLKYEPGLSTVKVAKGLGIESSGTRKIASLEDLVNGSNRDSGVPLHRTMSMDDDVAVRPMTYAYGALNVRSGSLEGEKFLIDRDYNPRRSFEGNVLVAVDI